MSAATSGVEVYPRISLRYLLNCCRIAAMLPAPSGETPLTIAILSIASPLELSVSAVYTANPLNGDGISIDVEYIPSRMLAIGGDG